MDENIVKQLAAGKMVFLKRRAVSPEARSSWTNSPTLKGRDRFKAAVRVAQSQPSEPAGVTEKTEVKGRARFAKSFKVA